MKEICDEVLWNNNTHEGRDMEEEVAIYFMLSSILWNLKNKWMICPTFRFTTIN